MQITGVVHRDDVAIVTVTRVPDHVSALARVLRVFADRHVRVLAIARTVARDGRWDLSLLVEQATLVPATTAADSVAAAYGAGLVLVDDTVALVSVRGHGLDDLAAAVQFFDALAVAGVSTDLVVTSGSELLAVVPRTLGLDLARALQLAFGPSVVDLTQSPTVVGLRSAHGEAEAVG